MKQQGYNLRSPKDPKFPHQRGYFANQSPLKNSSINSTKTKNDQQSNKQLDTMLIKRSKIITRDQFSDESSFSSRNRKIRVVGYEQRSKERTQGRNDIQKIDNFQIQTIQLGNLNSNSEKKANNFDFLAKLTQAVSQIKTSNNSGRCDTQQQSHIERPQDQVIQIKQSSKESVETKKSTVQKSISKSASDYIQALLSQVDPQNIQKQLTSKSLQQNYSYENQLVCDNQGYQEGQDDLNNEQEMPKRRYKKITHADRIGKTAGRWTRQEHIRFIQAIKLFGKDWKKVEDHIGTRTGAQIRSHAQKYFLRIEKEINKNEGSNNHQQQNDNEFEDSFHDNQNEMEQEQQEQEPSEDRSSSSLVQRQDSLYCEEDKKGEQKDQEEDEDIDDDKISLNTVSTGGAQPSQKQIETQTRERLYSIPSDFSTGLQGGSKQQMTASTKPTPSLYTDNSSLPEPIKNFKRSNSNETLDWTTQTFQNLQKIQYLKFLDIVKRKETLVSEMYTSDKDLFTEAKRYITQLNEIFAEIQQLAFLNSALQKTFQMSNPQINTQSSQFLEKILIFLADISNMQRVLQDFVQNINSSLNNIFNPQNNGLSALFNQSKLSQVLNQQPPIARSQSIQSQGFNNHSSSAQYVQPQKPNPINSRQLIGQKQYVDTSMENNSSTNKNNSAANAALQSFTNASTLQSLQKSLQVKQLQSNIEQLKQLGCSFDKIVELGDQYNDKSSLSGGVDQSQYQNTNNNNINNNSSSSIHEDSESNLFQKNQNSLKSPLINRRLQIIQQQSTQQQTK
ncbi:myb-like dna-binding shaqkyf class family protein [Stylonychia lemnae]|uniref:Myb-like dna-binding shaqkyf class family protein n=1 Tax=Stylonychia lemnae TaxID=5949 RepID=A0A078A6C6_STYLE|nr:myb-like dna-binding shaqkyf class family protein [Stylonychia lemnae]|eukprot:CDW77411.1 myb-like dna-binding shaqkyf class family protein [Stylonychia lemnae]